MEGGIFRIHSIVLRTLIFFGDVGLRKRNLSDSVSSIWDSFP